MRIAAILVAAGSGSRFGADTPKQFLTLAGKPVIRHAAEALAAPASHLQPVGDAAPIEAALAGIAAPADRPRRRHPPGQRARRAGGAAAARPGHRPGARRRPPAASRPAPSPPCSRALAHSPGAIPAAPVADTLKRGDNGVIVATVPREGLFRAQTPQAFRFDALLAAHRAGVPGATDDASLLEAAGQAVAIVPGADDNIKLTYPEDLARLERAMTA